MTVATYNIDSAGETLAQKPEFFFLQSTPASPLRFNERIVYSVLVKFSYQGRTARKVDIQQQSGLTRSQVNGALSRLSERVLAVQDSNTWTALAPTGEAAKWFLPRHSDKPKHWSDHIAYWSVKIEGKPLESVLVGMVEYHKGLRHTTATGIATRLGVAQSTISKLLAKSDKFSRDVLKWNSIKHPKTKQKTALRFNLDLVQQAEVKAAEAKASVAKQCETEPPPMENWRDIQNDLKRQGIPGALAIQIVDEFKKLSVDDWFCFLSRYWAICDEARTSHQENLRAGKVEVQHHGNLLKTIVERLAKIDVNNRFQEAQRWEDVPCGNVY